MNGAYLSRTAALIGADALSTLCRSTVAVVGLGGVGGHCAEALARSGVGKLVLVDFDVVVESNLNRQQFAQKSTVGIKKVDAARNRLEDVSDAAIVTLDLRIGEDTVSTLPDGLDFVVDAIDQLSGKLALAEFARARGIPMLSCMGAANRLDPASFSVTDVFLTSDCPLARRMRHELHQRGFSALPVVCSAETPQKPVSETLGSIAPATGAAGLVAAGYVIRYLTERSGYHD